MSEKQAIPSHVRSLFAAVCDEVATQQQFQELEAAMRGDERIRQLYLDYCQLHIDLYFAVRTPRNRTAVHEAIYREALAEHESPTPIIISTALRHTARPLASSNLVIAYVVATILFGLALGLGTVVRVSLLNSGSTTAKASSKSPFLSPTPVLSEKQVVGRITALADCQWTDPRDRIANGDDVPLSREYVLASGTLEVTYSSGADVILEGPCDYRVESAASGYLSRGRLCAKIDSGVKGERTANRTLAQNAGEPTVSLAPRSSVTSGQRRGMATPNSHSPSPAPHSPLFSVRTPTAVVTDFGTEFGVEVDHDGTTRTHVFQGKVELNPTGKAGQSGPAITLGENEWATVGLAVNRPARVVRGTGGDYATVFVRQILNWAPIQVFSTGAGLRAGDRDPHWHLLAWKYTNWPRVAQSPAIWPDRDPRWQTQARKDDGRPHVLNFQPIWPTAVIRPAAGYLSNDPSRSQWISAAGQFASPGMPAGVATFRTTFELPKGWSGSAVLRGGFIADQRVIGIWLNGKPQPVPEQREPASFDQFYPLVISEGFQAGTNMLVFEVSNRPVEADGPPPREPPMALRVELRGFELRGSRVAAASAAEQEKQPKK